MVLCECLCGLCTKLPHGLRAVVGGVCLARLLVWCTPLSGPSESWVRPVDVDVVGCVVPDYVVRVVVAAWWPAMEVLLVWCECLRGLCTRLPHGLCAVVGGVCLARLLGFGAPH